MAPSESAPPPDDPRLAEAREDLAQTTLAELPDDFSRLAYLASLRDLASDRYVHWGLEETYGPALAQAAIAREHQEVFRQLGSAPLSELAAQIRRFLAGREDGGRILLRNWQRDFSYNLLAPAGIDELELENFRINFEAVMAAAALQSAE